MGPIYIPREFLTIREANLQAFHEAHKTYMLHVATADDGVLLTEVVAGGRDYHRLQFERLFKRYYWRYINDEIADRTFAWFKKKYRDSEIAKVAETPGKVLDAIEPVAPPTAQEIEDAWEWESHSSEEAQRFFYPDRSSCRKIVGKDAAPRGPKDRGPAPSMWGR